MLTCVNGDDAAKFKTDPSKRLTASFASWLGELVPCPKLHNLRSLDHAEEWEVMVRVSNDVGKGGEQWKE